MAIELPTPDGWSTAKLSDLGEVNRGRSRHRPRHDPILYGGQYPFIQTGDVKESGGRISQYTQTYNEIGLAQSRLWPAGTMCITIAANIAETGILTMPACFPDSIIGFIADPSKCDINFVEYTFRNLKRHIQYQAEGAGTVQDNINLEYLEHLHFPIPSLPTQQAIASLLGALDDKIDLNCRINRTLEELTAALFKSWFVDFDPVVAKREGRRPIGVPESALPLFPEHFEESELGPVPQGWRIGRVRNVVSLSRDTINPREYPQEVFRHYSIPAFDDGRHPVVELGSCIQSLKYLVPSVCVLLSKLNPNIPRVWWPIESAQHREVASTEFLILLPYAPFSREFVYLLVQELGFRDDYMCLVTGTSNSHQRVKPEDFLNMRLVLPPSKVVAAFAEVSTCWLELTRYNLEESATLAALRDMLLGPLLSCEISLREGEAVVAEVT